MKTSFLDPQSISLARFPSRIEYLEKLNRAWNGPDIYIKGGDDTSCLLSGNKVKK